MIARSVISVALTACYVQAPPPEGPQGATVEAPPPRPQPRRWALERAGDHCTVVEQLDNCAWNAPCQPPPRDFPCPKGAVIERAATLQVDGTTCLYRSGPCPPGSANHHCSPEPTDLHVPCP